MRDTHHSRPGAASTEEKQVSTTSRETLVGRLLDARYLIGERIARGGMASVHLASDVRLDRTVAVKIMHPGLGDDDDFTARFQREARSAARLNHPNVVAVFDQGEDQGLVYLVMEYVPGHTLRDVIRSESPMPPRRALGLVEPLLVALSAAHDAKLIHRDVKPENVLITPDGRIKVADFGLARAVTGSTSTATTGVLIGTVSYLAPELVVNEGADARSDVYAVGALLYEMLTGQKPHVGDTPIQIAYKHVHEDIGRPSQVIGGIPPYVDALVARATSRARDQRSADAHVLLQQVRRARNALDQGLDDDLELTQDLQPHQTSLLPPDSVDLESTELALAAAAAMPAPLDPFPPSMFDNPTWDDRPYDQGLDETAAVAVPSPAARAEPVPPAATGPHQPMSRAEFALQSRPPRRRGPILLVLVLVLAVLAAMLGWYLGVGRYDKAPTLTGMTVAQAQKRAAGLDYTVRPSGQAYSETVPKGLIVSTDPGPDGKILTGGTIAAVVSKGKERYAVPDLSGRSQGDARSALAGLHLRVGSVQRRYSEKVAKDLVVGTVLDTGALVKRGTSIDLRVSRGRRPIEVTRVVGRAEAGAVKTLQDAGLKPTLTRAYDDKVAKGRVVSQDPDSGNLYKGDTVQLTVSNGPKPIDVPGVAGRNDSAARKILEDAGFKVRIKKERFYVGGGLVIRQSPGGGSQARPGSTITLFIV